MAYIDQNVFETKTTTRPAYKKFVTLSLQFSTSSPAVVDKRIMAVGRGVKVIRHSQSKVTLVLRCRQAATQGYITYCTFSWLGCINKFSIILFISDLLALQFVS